MNPTFASISGLVGLVIFIAIAIISSLFKRKEEGDFELPPELKPRRDKPPPQPQPPPSRNWEEQLRQLLEEGPAPPPIIQHVPPPARPLAERATGVPVPAQTRTTSRAVRPPDVEAEPHIQVMLSTPHARIEPSFQQLPGLTDSEARYTDAAHLQEHVTQHLADITQHRVGTTAVVRREISSEVRSALDLIKDRQAIRGAMLASIILGPPRALEV